MTNDPTVDVLRVEVHGLRGRTRPLRAELASELRTRRVVVADDGELEVDITPGRVGVRHPANDCHVTVVATGDTASVGVYAGDVPGAPYAELAATVMHDDADTPPLRHGWPSTATNSRAGPGLNRPARTDDHLRRTQRPRGRQHMPATRVSALADLLGCSRQAVYAAYRRSGVKRRRARPGPPAERPHGTLAAYRRHFRAGELPCRKCR